MAGLITAASIGYHSKGKARVLVLDRNQEDAPGKKTHNGWTCGDATSKRSLDYLAERIGIHYGSPELEHPVKGVYVYSPDRESKVLFEGEGYLFNRKLAPRRQVNDAKKVGAEFMFGATAERLLAEDGKITGVSGRKADGSMFNLTAKVVIDATGSSSTLRRFMPIPSKIEKEIDPDDVVGTGRYILDFEPATDQPSYFSPDYCIIHLDQFIAPAGYAWVFPKGKKKVNIGLGVSHSGLARRNRRFGLHDNLQSLIDKYLADNPAIKNYSQPSDDANSGNTKGNWQVPVRRHNDCMVANGFAVVGDAAWMPRPIDAGGISPSIYGGTILGRVVAEALEAGDTSESGLWKYNVEYMSTHGYPMASFEVLRRYLQTVTNDQINYGMKHFLSEEDVNAITERKHPEFNQARFMNPAMWYRVLGQLSLARGLRYTVKKSAALVDINMAYPSTPQGFEEWQKRLGGELRETVEKFKPLDVVS
ncbi:MAG: NAD(P)/FAD-dependent oxidoreductase [Nitrososphaerota archaeon]|nr:NAD(P)/FAD-dependent oxidoreductase [Nitrososphaerota archaeon]MDG6941635.1 NAD(P)/FAD-dependent oxidoreductase [Nitrososphaerota archaeon]MDG6947191.1 NAD(P)/FAD-dependent oxidoreductase [Nitrososphaerota archaeon]